MGEAERPEPGDDDVLIRVRAATLATADCELRTMAFPAWMRFLLRLKFGFKTPKVQILGQELAGDVVAVGGNVSGFKVGDAVFAALNGFGAHAEFACPPRRSAIAIKPDSIGYEDAACTTVFALNALHFVRLAEIERGNRMLINGAGGSMGTVAVQLAKHFGAEVTAVDKAGKLEMLRAIGADHVIDCDGEVFGGGGVYDVILDIHGKSPYRRCMDSLAPDGRYVLANPMVSSMLRSLWTERRSKRKVRFRFAGYRAEDLDFLIGLVAAGTLRPVIDRRYTLEQIAEAHRYVGSGAKAGNVIIVMGDDGADAAP